MYHLIALPVPTLVGLEVTTTPPAYTGLPSETLVDIGNLRVPEGTTIEWAVRSTDTDSLRIVAPGQASPVLQGAAGVFTSTLRATASGPYWLVPTNRPSAPWIRCGITFRCSPTNPRASARQSESIPLLGPSGTSTVRCPTTTDSAGSRLLTNGWRRVSVPRSYLSLKPPTSIPPPEFQWMRPVGGPTGFL